MNLGMNLGTNLADLMTKTTPIGDAKQRYTEYVVETQQSGKEALPFKEWYQLQQKK